MGRLARQEDIAMSRWKLFAPVFLAVVALTAGFVHAAYDDDDDDDEGPGPTIVNKNGFEIDERSIGKILADEALESDGVLLADPPSPVPGLQTLPQVQLRGGNTQVNDPAL